MHHSCLQHCTSALRRGKNNVNKQEHRTEPCGALRISYSDLMKRTKLGSPCSQGIGVLCLVFQVLNTVDLTVSVSNHTMP